MTEKEISITVRRFDPSVDSEPYDQIYQVPCEGPISVLQALDYIYDHLDGSLAYPDHSACAQGICKQCTLLINHKPRLMCQTMIDGDTRLEPPAKFQVVKDLVYWRGGKKSNER